MDHNTTQMKGNVVLHVRQDSDSDLEQLFNSVLSPRDGPKPVPLRCRKLPPSFFKPPSGSIAGSMQYGSPGSPMANTETPVMGHSRAHSSPASLGQMAVVQQQQQQQQQQHQQQLGQNTNFISAHHARAQSHDALESEPPLPLGWEARVTPQGQKYYIDHRDQLSSWTHPRMKASGIPVLAPNQQLPPLPDGIEQAVTPEGEIYFINHVTKTTSWFDPRLARPGGTNQQAVQQPAINQQGLRYMQAEKEKLRQHQLFLQQQRSQGQTDPLLNRSSMLGNLVREKFGNPPITAGVGIHGRVESVDSGLDGMGSFLSPTSSDVDVMNSMEDVDMEGDQPVGGSRFGSKDPGSGQDLRTVGPNRLPPFFDSMQGTNVDLGILEGDGDLTAGLDGISSENLGDFDMILSPGAKSEPPLTWL